MEVIKKLGNNAAICKDNSGRELIALGLGIGFPKCPYTLDDLSKIERTFYNVDNEYLYLFENVDSNILALSADVIDLATTMLSVSLKENAIYTLADHLNFAVIRLNKGMIFNTPISNELRDLYPVEVKVAKYTLNLMKKKLNIELPEEEMYAIAMNIINSEEILSSTSDVFVKSEFIIQILPPFLHSIKPLTRPSSYQFLYLKLQYRLKSHLLVDILPFHRQPLYIC